MATKIEKNWLNKLKENLNLISHQESSAVLNLDLPSDDVQSALKREMAKKLRNTRERNLVYRLNVV